MVKSRTSVRVFALLTFTLVLSAVAHAQSRTWVEGAAGDDAFPCSRTAPCKTFAGAISKTSDKGEINVISPGSYGAVTVSKNITIDGGSGTIAAITNAAANGVSVNDGATATPNTIVVTLRNLTINGAGTGGINGINFTSGKTLNVDHCKITQNTSPVPNGAGIRVLLTASGGTVNLIDSMIFNNRIGITATTSTGNVTVNVYRSVITHNTSDGLFLDARAFGTVKDSKLAFNGGAGVSLNNGAANSATVLGSELHHNNIGLFVGTGTTVRLGGSALNQNSTNVSNGGTIVTFCDNRSETNPFPGVVSNNCLK
jgi:hypothetical protein